MRNHQKEARLKAVFRATILENRYIPHDPTPKQAQFLLLDEDEAFYGGSAGGGKSDALLMAALQYAEVPGYAALILRRSYADLSLPGAIMDRAHEWLDGTDAKWHDQKKTWVFPSGASLTFGYLQSENDKYRYQSAEFQFIGFDELTQFSITQYRYLFSRLRRLKDSQVLLRMRSASNPGGFGHEWVKQRFVIEGDTHGRPFIPASLDDNPYLDRAEYVKSLNHLDPVTRAQLLKGDWSARRSDGKFRREWFEIVDSFPATAKKVRFWDLAATEPKPGKDPDWTVGALVAEEKGVYYIADIRRRRSTPLKIEQLIKQTAELDGKEVNIWMEQEGGASGVNTIDHYAREVLKGFTFRGKRPSGDKEIRANPVSSAAEAGNVKLVRGDWVMDFLDEVEAFPYGSHDDQVDATSGAFESLGHSSSISNTDVRKMLQGATMYG